jgi:hypothetical protein
MRRDLRIANEFDLDKIQVAVANAADEILTDREWYVYPRYETHIYLLEIYAADWLGTYQTEEIKSRFSLKLKLDEFAWDEIDMVFGSVADILNKRLDLSHPQLDHMSLGFGHNEGSPDWGLLLYFEIKGE